MSGQLVRETHLGGALVIGIGSILGTGAYVSIGLSVSIAGNLLMWAIVIAAFTALCNGLSAAQLATSHPVSGGTYEYAYRYLNPASGVSAGVLFVIAKSASAATAALAVAHYLNRYLFMPDWGIKAVSIVLLFVLTLAVLSGLRRSYWLNLTIVIISLIGLLTFVVVAFASPSNDAASSGSTTGGLSLFHAAALIFVAFTGYGRIATMGEEITRPRRNIPKAIQLTLGVITLIYLGVGLAVLHVFNPSVIEGQSFTIASLLPNTAWQWIIVFGGVIAMMGVVLNLLMGVSRVVMAMGRRGDLPGIFATLDSDNKSPPAASWLTFLIMSAIALFGEVQSAWTLSAFSVLAYYSMTNLAALKVEDDERFIPRWVSVAGLFSCCSLVILAGVA